MSALSDILKSATEGAAKGIEQVPKKVKQVESNLTWLWIAVAVLVLTKKGKW